MKKRKKVIKFNKVIPLKASCHQFDRLINNEQRKIEQLQKDYLTSTSFEQRENISNQICKSKNIIAVYNFELKKVQEQLNKLGEVQQARE